MFQFTGDSHSGDLMKLDGLDNESELLPGTEYDNGPQLKIADGAKNMDDWCLLDMHFGLPLFDAKLNKEISSKVRGFCNKIASDCCQSCWTSSSLYKMK
jgi:hypothetical protein